VGVNVIILKNKQLILVLHEHFKSSCVGESEETNFCVRFEINSNSKKKNQNRGRFYVPRVNTSDYCHV